MNLFRRNVLTGFFLYVLRVLCGEAFVSSAWILTGYGTRKEISLEFHRGSS